MVDASEISPTVLQNSKIEEGRRAAAVGATNQQSPRIRRPDNTRKEE